MYRNAYKMFILNLKVLKDNVKILHTKIMYILVHFLGGEPCRLMQKQDEIDLRTCEIKNLICPSLVDTK